MGVPVTSPVLAPFVFVLSVFLGTTNHWLTWGTITVYIVLLVISSKVLKKKNRSEKKDLLNARERKYLNDLARQTSKRNSIFLLVVVFFIVVFGFNLFMEVSSVLVVLNFILFISSVASWFVFYRSVSCPACGSKVSVFDLDRQCKHCGLSFIDLKMRG